MKKQKLIKVTIEQEISNIGDAIEILVERKRAIDKESSLIDTTIKELFNKYSTLYRQYTEPLKVAISKIESGRF